MYQTRARMNAPNFNLQDATRELNIALGVIQQLEQQRIRDEKDKAFYAERLKQLEDELKDLKSAARIPIRRTSIGGGGAGSFDNFPSLEQPQQSYQTHPSQQSHQTATISNIQSTSMSSSSNIQSTSTLSISNPSQSVSFDVNDNSNVLGNAQHIHVLPQPMEIDQPQTPERKIKKRHKKKKKKDKKKKKHKKKKKKHRERTRNDRILIQSPKRSPPKSKTKKENENDDDNAKTKKKGIVVYIFLIYVLVFQMFLKNLFIVLILQKRSHVITIRSLNLDDGPPSGSWNISGPVMIKDVLIKKQLCMNLQEQKVNQQNMLNGLFKELHKIHIVIQEIDFQ